mmetsp:Transcript_57/g.95  ORF Transcript_57/g.95 Transcript_57/m.95 type:complete len:140 (-) Transcript_57:8-427(-)
MKQYAGVMEQLVQLELLAMLVAIVILCGQVNMSPLVERSHAGPMAQHVMLVPPVNIAVMKLGMHLKPSVEEKHRQVAQSLGQVFVVNSLVCFSSSSFSEFLFVGLECNNELFIALLLHGFFFGVVVCGYLRNEACRSSS